MKNKKQSLLSIGALLTGAAALGKILGFLRGVLISYFYGATAQTDAFFLAIAIPTTLLGIFTYSADSAIIPQYRRISQEKGRDVADRNFSNILNILTIIGVIVTLLLVLFPSVIVKLFAPDFNNEQSSYAAGYLRYFCAGGLLHVLTCFFSAYCTVYQRVKVRSVLSFASNLIVVVSLLIWADPKMYFLAITFVAASIVGTISQIIVAYRIGYRHGFSVNIKQPEFREFIIIFLPIMGTALLNDIRILVGKVIASGMEIGTISYLDYANKFTSLFDSMIVVGIGVIVLPLFSNYALSNNLVKFKENAASMVLVIMLVLLPITIAMMVFSNEIIQLVYGRGSFNKVAIAKVAQALLYSAPVITLSPLNAVMSRIFYAKEDTKRPLIISAVSICINIMLSFVLSKYLGMIGIPLGTSIAGLINFLLLVIVMSINIGWSIERFGISHLSRMLACAIISSVAGLLIRHSIEGVYAKLAIGLITCIISYLMSSFIMFRNELTIILKMIKTRIRKGKQV